MSGRSHVDVSHCSLPPPAVHLSVMTLTVLLFASYADALGTSSLTVELAAGSTAADVVRYVRGLPGADRLPPAPLVAVNQRYAAPTQPLAANDEIALIPPVAGG